MLFLTLFGPFFDTPCILSFFDRFNRSFSFFLTPFSKNFFRFFGFFSFYFCLCWCYSLVCFFFFLAPFFYFGFFLAANFLANFFILFSYSIVYVLTSNELAFLSLTLLKGSMTKHLIPLRLTSSAPLRNTDSRLYLSMSMKKKLSLTC